MTSGRWPWLDQIIHYLREGIGLALRLRGKLYASFARFCVYIGAGLLGVSISTLVMQAVIEKIGGGSSNEAPWWVASGAGLFLILLGVGVFAYFHHHDPDRRRTAPLPTEDSVNIEIPPDSCFSQAVDVVGNTYGKAVTLQGFAQDELNATLKEGQMEAKNLEEALLSLRPRAARSCHIRAYSVTDEGSEVFVRVKEHQ